MNADDALLAIQEVMSGVNWSPDTLDEIRDIMELAGYKIEDSKDRQEVADEL